LAPASVRSAVKGLTKAVLRDYLERCASDALKSGDPEVYDELIETLTKFVKE
jgi:DNA-binding FrmR family transcriptional regulator